MSKYFKKIMKKMRGITPGYEKMQADSSHQQPTTITTKITHQ